MNSVPDVDEKKNKNWWEWVVIVLSIGVLWPTILGWDHWTWDLIELAFMALLVWVFIRRFRRVKSVRRPADDDGQILKPRNPKRG